MNRHTLSICLLLLTLALLTVQSSVTVNRLDNISAGNLVYSGFLPISDASTDQLFFTLYSCKDAKL